MTNKQPFLRNCWYPAAWDHEVGEAPLGRMFLDEPVVLYRGADGAPVALEDRCCHRSAPLSLGRVVEGRLRCGYHGLEFDQSGACVRIPGQTAIPPGARIKSYPVVEKYRWIWIWMGEAARADAALLPDWWWMDHPDWRVVKGDPPFHVECNYQFINDNLLDLSHLSFVHDTTIGTAALVDFPFKTEREDGLVRMTRWILDSPPPAMYANFLRYIVPGYDGNVDRWQIALTQPPSYNIVHAGSAVAGSGAPEGNLDQAVEFRNFNAITPETATTSHYFYAHARQFAQDDAEVDQIYARDFRAAFMEDIVVFADQQANIDRFARANQVDINVDGPGMMIRRMLADRIAAEGAMPAE